MSFGIYSLGKFKQGQFYFTENCKSKSETCKIISINYDVTTYIYEMPEYFKLDELRAFVAESFGNECAVYIARYTTDTDGNISVQFDGTMGDEDINNLQNVTFVDEDGDEEIWKVFDGDDSWLLTTSAYMSVSDVLIDHPRLEVKRA